ncbi:ABC transporter ATP-binding protein [Paludibacterium paludis]|uniref:ABC transporter ATP-binding protein n=1 Tax=Paludibacterium paludis TaxID=1225769 RepID=A0A918P7C1_9NEIS|nr:ABC transporter ATP-binding protein [Paludibacterium paludis]GGY29156.1 ABC transporter ATP-binding protein [Paludibacterium paludis]
MSIDPYIELRNVSFAYGERPILKNVNLSIPRGKLVAIMGGSGSGKTTLLRLISGQYRARKGEVIVDGRNVGDMSAKELFEHRRRMGLLFQFGALFTDLTVFENVAFPIREHTRLPDAMIRDLVTLKLNAVGLRGTQSLMPAELSGGMSRRVALARAIALDPALMLYDEPFTGLDPISLGVIAHLIKKLNDALGTTAIMVTHDVHTSLDIVDHVYFVSNGEIVAEGTPDEVRASPSPWVHQFVYGEADGPVHFAYPAKSRLEDDLGLGQGGAHA